MIGLAVVLVMRCSAHILTTMGSNGRYGEWCVVAMLSSFWLLVARLRQESRARVRGWGCLPPAVCWYG
jgi:hypothetical protein